MNNTTHRNRARRNRGFFNQEFNTMMNEIFNGPVQDFAKEVKNRFSRPLANILKTEDSYELQMAIPGIKKEDVSISIDNDKLTISSKSDTKDERNFRLREFNYGTFERSFTLSDDADVENISAKYDNGILILTIPKLPIEGPKKVEIV